MSKLKLGLLLGAVLGALDGLSALFHPLIRLEDLGSIVPGSTVKGLLTGLAAGFAARRFDSLAAGIGVGAAVALVLSYFVGVMVEQQTPGAFWQIVLPGTAIGVVVGFAAQRYGAPRAASLTSTATPSRSTAS